MRGIEQQKQYNTFIRIKKHARQHQSQTIKHEDIVPNKQGAKENSQSTYLTQPYFHEGEEKLQKMVYCNYSWSAIGSVDISHKQNR